MGPAAPRLVPDVAACTPGGLHVGREIASLARAERSDLPEAAAFHAGRLLEATAIDAAARAGVPGADGSFEALARLERFQLVERAVRIWAHGLRRLGNEARHFLRPFGRTDGVLAALLAERWIDWTWRRFAFGPRLAEITDDGAPLRLVEDDALRAAFAGVESDLVARTPPSRADEPRIVAETPILACALAEALLDAGEVERAGRLLARALDVCPSHARLRQLDAVRLSRVGRFDEAVVRMQVAGGRAEDDPEAAGILAGIHKRLWRRGLDRAALAESHRIYAAAWRRFGRSNLYLGVNVAATALWLGRTKESRETATACRTAIEAQVAGLRATLGDRAPPLGPWERATLAEAYLLEGRSEDADRSYRELVADPARPRGVVEVARAQAVLHYRSLGRAADVDGVFGAALVVGVTGHRALADAAGVETAVRAALERRMREDGQGRRLVIVSALAEGADRLVAQVGLSHPFSGELRALLPMAPPAFAETFSDDASRRAFGDLLERASVVEVVGAAPEDASPEAAYEAAGRAMADRSDVVLALYDGGAARGRGGTAEIVAYSRARGTPVEVIETGRA